MNATSKDSVRSYLTEIGRIPLLTLEQEIILGKRVQRLSFLYSIKEKLKVDFDREPTRREWAEKANCSMPTLERDLDIGKQAKDRLIAANLRLVVSIAKKYQNRGLDFLDLIQEGNTGLITATEKFDPTKGYKFSTYAYWWIRQAIIRGIRFHNRVIRLPHHAYDTIYKIKKATEYLSWKKGSTPSIAEIAENTQEKPESIKFYLQVARQTFSLDRKVRDDDDNSILSYFLEQESIRPTDSLIEEETPKRIDNFLAKVLNPQEREILTLNLGLYSEPQSCPEIARHFGVSRQRINQIKSRAIEKLKKAYPNKKAINF